MKKGKFFSIEIDKLTNSIENVITAEIFPTECERVIKNSKIILKKNEWNFNLLLEIKNEQKEVYKLITQFNPSIIHGLISISDEGDHIFMHLIEAAQFNRGKKKLYKGVAGNLIAFACKKSFEKKYAGVVAFEAKSKLIEHYKKSLQAKHISANRMFIDTNESRILVNQYFQNK